MIDNLHYQYKDMIFSMLDRQKKHLFSHLKIGIVGIRLSWLKVLALLYIDLEHILFFKRFTCLFDLLRHNQWLINGTFDCHVREMS